MVAAITAESPGGAPAPGGAQDGLVVTVKDLSVHYLGRRGWVLDSVDLTHLRGRVTAVIGPSGCGKTTLVRTLCGLVPHCLPSRYAGSACLSGTEIADATVRFLAERVGYVGQNPDAAVVTRTVHDDVAFPLANLCLGREEIEARVIDSLFRVGLLERIWEDPWTLSGGQRQRLAAAAALAMRPGLLILDEPTSTIDTTGRAEFYGLIAQLVSTGTGVIVIDHDLDPILPLVDQVLALDASGRTIATGSPRDVFMTHRCEFISAGVWMPRALRSAPTGPGSPLTCAEAGITVPALSDLCAPGAVRCLRRGEAGWQQVESIDTADTADTAAHPPPGEPAPVDLVDLEVPGRCPPVTMRLGGGELLALVGPNGAGKSSLLSALGGLIDSTATRATVCGRPIKRGRHRVGYVFQNPEHQFVTTTVRRELAVGGATPERVEELLTQFHLTEHADHHPLTLSGGQARRLSVATMVSEERQVIVLDEPTYGQDWDNTCELMAFIEELRGQGRTIIVATHDLELALDHCTHVLALPAPEAPGATPVSGTTSGGSTAPSVNSPRPRSPGHGAPEGGLMPPPRPRQRPGLLTGLNPLTLFGALIPAMVMIFALKEPSLNVTVLASASLLMVAARAPRRRTIASVAGVWAITGLLAWVFSGRSSLGEASKVYDLGTAAAGATGIGALVALVLLSGISTDPEALIRTLTSTFRMPYRIGSAGTAAIAFTTRFRQDFATLRTARALRGIGKRWGPLAPLVRWAGSLVPLMILAVQHAERVALSMDSRAFGAYPQRTELADTPWRRRDWAVMACTWAATACTWAWLL